MAKTYQQKNENSITKQMQKNQDFKSLFVVHVNLNGLKENGFKLRQYFFKDGSGPDLICISETHRNPNPLDLNTSKIRYNQLFSSQYLNTYSGVGMYVNSSLRWKKRKDLSEIIVTNSVHQWVELIDDHGKQIVVGVVYRHNNSSNVEELCQVIKCKGATQFLNDFKVITEKIRKEGKTFYVLGDFNIHLEKSENKKYKNRLEELKYEQLITKPTHGKSLIDHIYTNDFSNSLNNDFALAGVAKDLESVFSHSPIYCFISNTAFYCTVECNLRICMEKVFKSNLKLFEKKNIFKQIEFFSKSPIATKMNFQDTHSLFLLQLKSFYNQFSTIEKEYEPLFQFLNSFENESLKKSRQLMIKTFNKMKNLAKTLYTKMLHPDKDCSLTFVKKSIEEISSLLDSLKICQLLEILKSIEYSDDKPVSRVCNSHSDQDSEDPDNYEESELSSSDDDEDSDSSDLDSVEGFDSSDSDNDQNFTRKNSIKEKIKWNELKIRKSDLEMLKNCLCDSSLVYKVKVLVLEKKTSQSPKNKKYWKLIMKTIKDYNKEEKGKEKIALSKILKKYTPDSVPKEEFKNFLLEISPVKCPRVATYLEKLKNLLSQLEIEIFETKNILCRFLWFGNYLKCVKNFFYLFFYFFIFLFLFFLSLYLSS